MDNVVPRSAPVYPKSVHSTFAVQAIDSKLTSGIVRQNCNRGACFIPSRCNPTVIPNNPEPQNAPGDDLAAYPRYPLSMTDIQPLHLHLVSDATGETLNSILRATLAQFEESKEESTIVHHRWSLIRTRFQLHRVIDGIEAEPGPILSTLVEMGMRSELDVAAQRLNLPLVHVLDPVLAMLQSQFGHQATARPGKQYVLDAAYFKRIDAMHYILAHDDGQAQSGIAEADVVLVGVSRSSKTPTCFYLANRGIKAANIPLVPGTPEPPGLENPHCPVIGLSIDPEALIDIRRNRLRMIASGSPEVSRGSSTDYVDPEAVRAELLWAKRLCAKRGWPMIDVTRRSIEETSATVLHLMETWHTRRKATP